MHDPTEGAVLAGRYTLVRRVGSGGMSQTWLAEDRRNDSRVALKIPRGTSASDQSLSSQVPPLQQTIQIIP